MAKRKINAREIVNVGFSASKFEEARTALGNDEQKILRAMSAAVNKTTAKTRTMMFRGMTRYTTIKRKNLARRTYVSRATPQKLFSRITMMGRPIGLINFKHFEDREKSGWGTAASGTGVYVEVVRGVKHRFRHSFIATGNMGNVHVVTRTGRKRLPIETVFSQRLNKLYDQSPVPQQIAAFVPGDLNKQLSSQIDRFLFKAK